jgi:MFS family permease
MALASFGALGGARLLAPQPPQPASDHAATDGAAWRNVKALPTYFVSAVMGYAEGTINVALAPLMPIVGARPATAGFLIALLSLASAAGGFGYAAYDGRRPGDAEWRSNVAILLLGACTALVAFAPSIVVLTLAVAACGLWIAPLLTMRNLVLGKLLPASQLSEGFSTLSAVGQIGYGVSGIVTGIVLGAAGARACFVIAAVFTTVSGVAVSLLYRSQRRR